MGRTTPPSRSGTMTVSDLPALNAGLNSASALLLAAGWFAIRGGRVQVHRALMGSAFVCSTLFLASYLVYHAQVGSKPFPGTGAARQVYFVILGTHTALALVNLPLVLRTLSLALKERFAEHRRLARWTLPVWMYVSVTGVVVYWMLYRMEWAAP